MVEWRFPSNDHGEKKGINDSGVATFRGTPLKSLAREMSEIPGIEILKDVFNRCKDYWSISYKIYR